MKKYSKVKNCISIFLLVLWVLYGFYLMFEEIYNRQNTTCLEEIITGTVIAKEFPLEKSKEKTVKLSVTSEFGMKNEIISISNEELFNLCKKEDKIQLTVINYYYKGELQKEKTRYSSFSILTEQEKSGC